MAETSPGKAVTDLLHQHLVAQLITVLQVHHTEIALFESAQRYLEQHLNGHTPPLLSWKEEQAKLLAERAALNQ